jgi:WD40 repeat protein
LGATLTRAPAWHLGLFSQVWSTAYGACMVTVPHAHAGGISVLSVDGCGASDVPLIISGGAEDGALRAWSLDDGAPRGSVAAHTGAIVGLAAARDDVRVFTAGADGACRLWVWLEASGGSFSAMATAPPGQGATAGALTALVLNRAEDAVFTACASGGVRVLRAADLTPLRALLGHVGAVVALALSRADDVVASAGADGAVRVWRAADGECTHALTAPLGDGAAPQLDTPTSVALASDGGVVYAGYASGALRAWRADTGACTHTSPPAAAAAAAAAAAGADAGAAPFGAGGPPAAPVTVIALSRNDDRLAVGGADGGVRVLRAGDLAAVHALWGHRESITCVTITKDGREVLAGGLEGVLRKWQVGPALGFTRAACLNVDVRNPGCIPNNLTKVLSQLATAAGTQITPARRAQAAAAVTAAVGAATNAATNAAAAVAAAVRERRGGAAGADAADAASSPKTHDGVAAHAAASQQPQAAAPAEPEAPPMGMGRWTSDE